MGLTKELMTLRKAAISYVFILPFFLGMCIFVLYPSVLNLILSFFKYNPFKPPEFIGISNYKSLFEDPAFIISIKNTIYFLIVTVIAGTALALIFALAIEKAIKGAWLYEFIYFIPMIYMWVAAALVWKWIYHPTYGLLNSALSYIGIPPQMWLSDPKLALNSIIVVAVWKTLGFYIIIFLAGLRNIPKDLYDAAIIDGAFGWKLFWHITLPLLRPTTYFIIIWAVIRAFQVFTPVFIITMEGPAYRSAVILTRLYIMGFKGMRLGYAAAQAMILFIMIFSVTMIQRKFMKEIY